MFPLHAGQLVVTLLQCEGVSFLPLAVQTSLLSPQLIIVAQGQHLTTESGSTVMHSKYFHTDVLLWCEQCLAQDS